VLNSRFLSPGAAFAAQQEEETRLLILVEKQLSDLAETAQANAKNYSMSRLGLKKQWEQGIVDALETLEFTGVAALELQAALIASTASDEVFDTADSVMKYGLSVGASKDEIEEAVGELLGESSLTAAGGVGFWKRIKEWMWPKPTQQWRSRAKRLVRTAYTGYAGKLAQSWLKENGYSTKMWITRHDDKVRATHAAANGQIVPIDDKFRVGLAVLTYPGERSGLIGETINCRCVMVSGD